MTLINYLLYNVIHYSEYYKYSAMPYTAVQPPDSNTTTSKS